MHSLWLGDRIPWDNTVAKGQRRKIWSGIGEGLNTKEVIQLRVRGSRCYQDKAVVRCQENQSNISQRQGKTRQDEGVCV